VKLVLATKQVGENVEGALIVDGRFCRSGSAERVGTLLDILVWPTIGPPEDGTEIHVEIDVVTEADVAAEKRNAALAKVVQAGKGTP
jgi:hypothetical protein